VVKNKELGKRRRRVSYKEAVQPLASMNVIAKP